MLPLKLFVTTAEKKRQCYPLCFFWQRPEKNDSVTPYIFLAAADKKRVLPLTFFLAAADEKQQCYPLRFFLGRLIENDSVTPYAFCNDGR